jgi:hypothetical protein
MNVVVSLLFSFVSWVGLYRQEANSKSPQSAGSYTLEWRRHYQRQVGLAPNGIADDSGTLWLITHAGPGEPGESLTRINSDGQLIGAYQPILSLSPSERVASLAPAASDRGVGLLASIASGGRDQTFEGAFFVPVGSDGLGNPVRISGRGPQIPTMIGAGGGEFLAAGDQEPLTLIKLDSTGKLLWRRAFSPRLVLPSVSIGSSGSIFVLSQGDAYILLQMLDSSGRVLRSKRISAKQGTVVADPVGGCSLLFSTLFGGSNKNKVYLMTLDRDLHELSNVQTPLVGFGGRTYQLISSPRGHLIAGEGPEPNPQKVVPKKILAEFDKSGTLIWQQSTSSLETPLLAPFRSGFYLVRELFEGKGMDVEKYAY